MRESGLYIGQEGTVTIESAVNGGDGMGQMISEALYWEMYYDYPDVRYEWNNGELEEIPVTDYTKYMMYLWFLGVLRDYLYVRPIARIIGLDLGFRLALRTKTTIRKPDLGLVLHTNPIPLGDHDRSYRGVFDLCIESLSDGSQREIDRDAIIKRDEYAAAGVQEYYLLDERSIETEFYHRNRRGFYEPLPREDGVVRSLLLPGFQFRIDDLYTLPDTQQMVQDPVYRDFISPFYRAERQRAEEERRRADEERQRADEERQRADEERQRAENAEARAENAEARADTYAVLLRSAGLLPAE